MASLESAEFTDSLVIDKITKGSIASDLDRNITQALTEWTHRSNSVRILVSGKTGIGKSTLINGIVGQNVAGCGTRLKAKTDRVQGHTFQYNDVDVTIYDTPGLCDRSENQAKYVAEIQEHCKDIDLFIYCFQMSATRILAGDADSTALKILTQALGESIWKNGMIVLTFANQAVSILKPKCRTERKSISELFSQRNFKICEKIRTILQTEIHLQQNMVENVTIIPAGHVNTPLLPRISDRQVEGEFHWLSYLWLKAFHNTKCRAQPALIQLNSERIRQDDCHQHYTPQEASATVRELADMALHVFTEKGSEIGLELGESGRRIGRMVGEKLGLDEKSTVLAMLFFALRKDDD